MGNENYEIFIVRARCHLRRERCVVVFDRRQSIKAKAMRRARPEPPEREGEGAVKKAIRNDISKRYGRFVNRHRNCRLALGNPFAHTAHFISNDKKKYAHCLRGHFEREKTMETVTRRDSCPANLSFKRHTKIDTLTVSICHPMSLLLGPFLILVAAESASPF